MRNSDAKWAGPLRPWIAAAMLLPAMLMLGGHALAAEKIVIKKSKSGICHDPTSPSYSQVVHFVEFDSLDACIASGGRLPRGATEGRRVQPVRKSRNGICHDASSPKYATMKQFEIYANMEACVMGGGRPSK